jgi:hypothetical protein
MDKKREYLKKLKEAKRFRTGSARFGQSGTLSSPRLPLKFLFRGNFRDFIITVAARKLYKITNLVGWATYMISETQYFCVKFKNHAKNLKKMELQ